MPARYCVGVMPVCLLNILDFEDILHESDIQMRNYKFYKIFPIVLMLNSGFW